MMHVPSSFYVTPYYKDNTQHDRDVEPLRVDAHTAYDASKQSGGMNEKVASTILLDWALQCSEVVNKEAKFTMTFIGHLFLETYLNLDPESWNSGVFLPWVDIIYRECAEQSYWKNNNHGSWGILGCILSDKILNRNCKRHEARLADHMDQSWDSVGVMTHEIKRTNSGIWYSYFSLAPMLRACQLLNSPLIKRLESPLLWLFYYSKYPHRWPYRPMTGILGWLQNIVYPHADALQLPRTNDWPANLFLAAGQEFDNQRWKDYANRPLQGGVHIFREAYFTGV